MTAWDTKVKTKINNNLKNPNNNNKKKKTKPTSSSSWLHFAFGSVKRYRLLDIRKDKGQQNGTFLGEDATINFTLERFGTGPQARKAASKIKR